MPDEKKEHQGPTINARVKRNDHWEHVEIDKLTADELAAVLQAAPAEQLVALRAAVDQVAANLKAA